MNEEHLKIAPKNNAVRGVRHKALAVSLVAVTVVVIVLFGLEGTYREFLIAQERASIRSKLESASTSLTNSLNSRFSLLQGLKAFVETANKRDRTKADLDTSFELFSSGLYSSAKGIRNFIVAPDGVNQYVYPLELNRKALGHNLLRDKRPQVRKDVQRAIDKRGMALSGPYELRQGGLGIVLRAAVYDNERFWGLVSMVLDVPPILAEVNLSPLPVGIRLALSDSRGNIFYGEKNVYESTPEVQKIPLPEGEWLMAMAPTGGWGLEIAWPLGIYRILAVAIALLTAFTVYLLSFRHARLQLAVQKRTHELGERTKELRCLYNFSLLTEAPAKSLNEMLQDAVALIPPGWQYPEITRARITLDNGTYVSEDFQETQWRLSQDLMVRGERVGAVEVFYLKKMPDFDEGPFLKEERNLIDEFVRYLGQSVERKQAEKTLRESDARMQSIFRVAPSGIGVVADRVLKQVNERMCEITGYSEEELTGQNARMLYPTDEDFEYVGREKYVQIRDHGTGTVETRWLCKDGRIIDVLLSSTPLDMTDLSKGVTFTALDITERKRMEEAMRTLVETTVGRSGQECLDRITSELCRWLNLDAVIIGEVTEGDTITTRSVVVDGIRVPDISYRLSGTPCENVTSQGACLYPEGICDLFPEDRMLADMGMDGYAGSPLKNRLGVVVGVLCGLSRRPLQLHAMWKDIMAVMGTKAAEELERRVVEEELVYSKEKAESANKAKSEFLANMSHEIRTPLNGVLGMMQILQESPLNEEQKECIETAMNSGRSLIRVISDILDLSRIESGKMDIREEAFDPEGILSSIQAAFMNEAGKKGLAVSYQLSPMLPSVVTGDSGRLRQVLFNLVGNAIKFTGQGEVKVNAYPENMGSDSDPFDLCLEVSDTGIGIPEEQIAAIFEPFTQVDGTNTRKYGGTGLGLSIVKRLVELMGGAVQIESEEGVGTTIRVRIPTKAVEGGRPAVEEHLTTAAISLPALKILLAEDDLSNQLVARRLLEKQGHTVTCVETGKEALVVLEKEAFDLILMDVQMPEMDGTEATREIRKDERFKDLPIVALTAHAMSGDRERFLEAGMDDYLSKPIEVVELTEAIGRVMRSRSR